MIDLLLSVVLASALPPGGSPPDDSAVTLDDYSACGHTCTYVIARWKGCAVEWGQVKELVGPPTDGMHTFSDLADACRKLGLFPVGAEVTRTRLMELHAHLGSGSQRAAG